MSGITAVLTLRGVGAGVTALDLPHVGLEVDPARYAGRGAALKAGLSEALALGAERVLTLDAGRPVSEGSARRLLDRLEHHAAVSRGEHGHDVVIGRPAGRPPRRERLFAAMANRRLHADLSMYHGVTVAYRADALRVVHLERLPDDGAFERALILSLLARGLRASELELSQVEAPSMDTPGAITRARDAWEAAVWLAWPRA